MSKETKHEIFVRLLRRCATAGAQHKGILLDRAVELLGYHRKAAICALRAPQPKEQALKVNVVLSRPKRHHPENWLPILKPIWISAFQPCDSRLHALLPVWLPAYELLVAEGISRTAAERFTRRSNKLLFGTGLRAKFCFADAEQSNQFSCGTGAERIR